MATTTSGKEVGGAGGDSMIKLNENEKKLLELLKKPRVEKETLVGQFFTVPFTRKVLYGEIPSMFEACTGGVVEDNFKKVEERLKSLNIEQLRKIKKELDDFSTEEELRGKILTHFLTAKDMFEDPDHNFHSTNDGFDPVLETEENSGNKLRATNCLSMCDQGPDVEQNKNRTHRLLDGATREHKLRAMLKTTPLPDLRRLRDQFQEEDEIAEIIDQICTSWKMEVFRRVEQEKNESNNRNKKEFYFCGCCFKMDISEEYSFVPGDKTNTLRHFLYSRWKHSNLHKYLGDFSASLELTPEETDQTVNALILLEALILTIPFGLIPNLGTEFWDNLQEKYQACPDYPDNWTANRWFKGWHSKTTIWIQVVIYVVTAAISLACFYYTNRPKEVKKFRQWWITGKYTFYLIQLLSVISVILLLSILSALCVIVMSSSSMICENVRLAYDLSPKTQQFNVFSCAGLFAIVVVSGFILTI